MTSYLAKIIIVRTNDFYYTCSDNNDPAYSICICLRPGRYLCMFKYLMWLQVFFSGQQTPQTINSPGPRLVLLFKAGSKSASGFKAQYRFETGECWTKKVKTSRYHCHLKFIYFNEIDEWNIFVVWIWATTASSALYRGISIKLIFVAFCKM